MTMNENKCNAIVWEGGIKIEGMKWNSIEACNSQS